MNLFISWIVNFIILSDWIGSLVKSFKMFKVYIICVHFAYILTSARIVVFNIVDIKLLAHPCDSINLWEFTFFKRNAKQTSLRAVSWVSSGGVKLSVRNRAGSLLVHGTPALVATRNCCLLPFVYTMKSASGLVLQASGCVSG